MKIILVHDWLIGMRGGEKVLEALCEIFPHAPIYTLFHFTGEVSSEIENHPIKTSFLNYFPMVEKYYRYLLPLFPLTMESFTLPSDREVIISTSHCVAKGIIPFPHQIHISYIHSPMRYIWDLSKVYFPPSLKSSFIEPVLHYLRIWDVVSSQRVDYFIANSLNIAKKIKKYYGRDSEVIYPPVETNFFTLGKFKEKEDFYLMVSSLVPYKKINLAIQAFNILKKPLVIIGKGPQEKSLKKMAKSNITFLGWKSPMELRNYYRKCRALIFPGEEDFGIVPVEAQACGRPVIAYKKGGALESIKEGETGLFFYLQNEKALMDVIKKFERIEKHFSPERIRENALRFDKNLFKKKIKNFIKKII